MSNTPNSPNTAPSAGGKPSGRNTPKRNTKKIVAATVAVVATLAASGAAVAVNLGASEPPLDPAAGQLTATDAATSARDATTDPLPVDPTGTRATLVPEGTTPVADSTPNNCEDARGGSADGADDDDHDEADDHDDDCTDEDERGQDEERYEDDEHDYEGADDDD